MKKVDNSRWLHERDVKRLDEHKKCMNELIERLQEKEEIDWVSEKPCVEETQRVLYYASLQRDEFLYNNEFEWEDKIMIKN